MKYIATTRSPINIYKVIVESCKKHAEKKLNKKLEIIVLKNEIPTVGFFLFFFFSFLSGKIFSNEKFIKLKYKKCSIGRHAFSTTLRDTKSYLSSVILLKNKIKYLILSGIVIDSAYKKIDKVDAVYVDHGVYLNGLIIQVFANNKKLVYQNVYPRGLSCKDCRNYNKEYFLEYEDLLILRQKEIKLSKKQKKLAKSKIKAITHHPGKIPWLRGTRFSKIKKLDYKSITHVIYTHSFADGQLVWGTDDFSDTRDWLEHTLRKLDKKNNKIYVKAHPNFTIRGYYNEACALDRKIFFIIKEKFKSSKRFYFEEDPVKNCDLLKKLNKKTVLISHHGSAILEGIYKKFKMISSSATFWEKKMKVSNNWSNKFEYNKLLNLKWKDLKYTNKEDFYKVCYLLYCNKYGNYGKNYWHEITVKTVKISRKMLLEQAIKSNNVRINNILRKKKNILKLTNNISRNIQELN